MTSPDRAEELGKYINEEMDENCSISYVRYIIRHWLQDNPSPASVNVDELKTRFYREFTTVIPNSHMTTNNEELGKIWNFFLPHLRTKDILIRDLTESLEKFSESAKMLNRRIVELESTAPPPDIEKLRDEFFIWRTREEHRMSNEIFDWFLLHMGGWNDEDVVNAIDAVERGGELGLEVDPIAWLKQSKQK